MVYVFNVFVPSCLIFCSFYQVPGKESRDAREGSPSPSGSQPESAGEEPRVGTPPKQVVSFDGNIKMDLKKNAFFFHFMWATGE